LYDRNRGGFSINSYQLLLKNTRLSTSKINSTVQHWAHHAHLTETITEVVPTITKNSLPSNTKQTRDGTKLYWPTVECYHGAIIRLEVVSPVQARRWRHVTSSLILASWSVTDDRRQKAKQYLPPTLCVGGLVITELHVKYKMYVSNSEQSWLLEAITHSGAFRGCQTASRPLHPPSKINISNIPIILILYTESASFIIEINRKCCKSISFKVNK